MKKKKSFSFKKILSSLKLDKKPEKTIKKPAISEKTAKIYEDISKWAIYILVFLLPLFFLPFTINSLDFNKQALLIVLVFVSLFFWMIKTLVSGKISFNTNKFHILIGVFLLIYIASTIFSIWRYGSFWGWPLTTSESLISVFSLILLYFLINNIFKKKEILNLVSLLLLSGLLAVLFGIFQMFSKFIIPFDFAKVSSFNTIGSVNRLGLFSVVLLPLIIGLLMIGKKRISKSLAVISLISFIVLLVLINFSIVWWAVIIGAGLVMAFGMQKSNIFDSRFLILPMFFLALSLFFIFFRFQIPGMPSRPLEVFLTYRASFSVAQETLKEMPILGTGPGTFIYDFSKRKDINFNNSNLWNIRFDSAVSKILGSLSTIGALGLISLLSLIGFFIFYGIKFFFKKEQVSETRSPEASGDRVSGILAMSMFISFIVLSFIYFLYNSNLTLDFLFFFLMACFMVLMSDKEKTFTLKPSSLVTLGVTFSFTLVFILGLGLFILEGQRYMAEVFYLKGVKSWQNNNTDATLNYLERAVKINPKTDVYWRDLSQVYLKKINEEAARTDISREEKNQRIQFLINNTVNSSKMATDINPKNVANWSVRGFIYQNLVGIVGGVRVWAEKVYDEALSLEPTNPYYPAQKGMAFLREAIYIEKADQRQELFENARISFEKAVELKSDYAPAHFQIAMIYQSQGKTKEAIDRLEAIKSLAPRDIGLAFQLGLIYYQNKNYSSAEAELTRAVAINPDYANALYFLGLTYSQEDQRTKAIEVFERIRELNPDSREISIILANLKSGRPALEGVADQVPPEVPIEEEPSEIEK